MPTSAETSPTLVAILAAVDVDRPPYRSQTSPDGMMTIVFTDVEGSTALMEQLGEERWLAILRDHSRLLRKRVAAHGGLVVKSQGDGFMLIFASASAALACAAELQRIFALYNEEHPDQRLNVRIGIHTGNVFEENDDFFGRAVVLAARITGRARGGEVLVSEACREYTEHLRIWRFGPALALRLKGLRSPERVHAVDWTHGDDPQRGRRFVR
jgi:class 3 adenylate cyclase